MKRGINLYLHIHQPFRVRPYSVFDIGHQSNYFLIQNDTNLNNERVFHKVAGKSYRPMLGLIEKLLAEQPDFKLSLSISGVFLDQAELWGADLLDSIRRIVATGRVEIVAETYHHSLAFFYSREEFEAQVALHTSKIQQLFGVTPSAFRNTELAYNDELAQWADKAGYQAILAEGWDPVLAGRTPSVAYRPEGTESIKLLMKNYRLSDDIAFRFGNRTWTEFPLTAGKFTHWLDQATQEGPLVNLFMDFETFGEHQWADTDIFGFFEQLVNTWLEGGDRTFYTVTQAAQQSEPQGTVSMPNVVTWADSERDLSAWTGNSLQQEALRHLYAVEHDVMRSGDAELIRDWRYLQSSDHAYYMATKWLDDGAVHSYFSPYESPYDAFLYYMNAIRDIRWRVMKHHRLGGFDG